MSEGTFIAWSTAKKNLIVNMIPDKPDLVFLPRHMACILTLAPTFGRFLFFDLLNASRKEHFKIFDSPFIFSNYRSRMLNIKWLFEYLPHSWYNKIPQSFLLTQFSVLKAWLYFKFTSNSFSASLFHHSSKISVSFNTPKLN